MTYKNYNLSALKNNKDFILENIKITKSKKSKKYKIKLK